MSRPELGDTGLPAHPVAEALHAPHQAALHDLAVPLLAVVDAPLLGGQALREPVVGADPDRVAPGPGGLRLPAARRRGTTRPGPELGIAASYGAHLGTSYS